jgi:serine O-acetyltransferase
VFDNIREDWRTYERQWTRQGLWVMVVYRFGNWRYGIQNRALRLPVFHPLQVAEAAL